jgi:hypothetical protein
VTSLAVPISTEQEHIWELRGEEFEEGLTIRRFECVGCGAVRFE